MCVLMDCHGLLMMCVLMVELSKDCYGLLWTSYGLLWTAHDVHAYGRTVKLKCHTSRFLYAMKTRLAVTSMHVNQTLISRQAHCLSLAAKPASASHVISWPRICHCFKALLPSHTAVPKADVQVIVMQVSKMTNGADVVSLPM